MAIVVAALAPVFILIVLGVILKRSLMRLETQWHGLERLTYYVLFPMLLIQTLVKADLSKVPVAGVGGALFLSALAMSLLCLALRPALARLNIDGPAFTAIFQGATRWQTLWRSRCPEISVATRASRWPPLQWSPSSHWSMCSASRCWRTTPHPRSNRPRPSS